MATIPKKVHERLVAGLKRYQPILAAAKARDVGEADTVTIIKDMLADVFGYLSAAGCDIAQGYFIGRPMPGEQLAAWREVWQQRWHDGEFDPVRGA